MRGARRFPLGVQLTLPEKFLDDREFLQTLSAAAGHGLSELELNIVEPGRVDPAALRDCLADFGLSMTRLASGATARSLGLSLCTADEKVRKRSIADCVRLIQFASSFPAEVIVGLIKGGPAGDPSAARERFRQSLSELARACEPGRIPILLEATNRYESPVANTLQEAADLSEPFAGRGMAILPDTFHMNIEESDGSGALRRFRGRYHSVHISDNNRLLPGLGELDFGRVLGVLTETAYTGSLVFEGNTRGSFREDLERSVDYMDALLERLEGKTKWKQ